MGLQTTLEGLRTYLISANLTGIDASNCTVADDSVFNTILLEEEQYKRRAVIINYAGINRKTGGQPSEFGGTMFNWVVAVDAFFPLWGDRESELVVKEDAHAFVDEFIDAINADSTLNGVALDTMIVYGSEPLSYTRQSMNTYYMISFELWVRENR